MTTDTGKPDEAKVAEKGRHRKEPARTPRTRELESRPCRRCGAQPGLQCVTASGTGASYPHAERRNDSHRAAGWPESTMAHEGT